MSAIERAGRFRLPPVVVGLAPSGSVNAGLARASANCAALANRSGGNLANACVRLRERGIDVRGHHWPSRCSGHRVLGHDLRQHGLYRGSRVRRFAHQHLVDHRAERVDVAARVDLSIRRRLLRTHVFWRAQRQPCLGDAIAPGRGDRQRDPEIRHHRLAFLQQDIARLDIAVNHVAAVRVLQRRRHLRSDFDGLVHGQLPLDRESIAERLALDVGHHVKEETTCLAGVVERQDVRVLQVSGDLDLVQEPLGAKHGGKFGVQHLDGDLAVVPDVVRKIDRRHAAAAELTLDRVAVG
jgi:hypothetical protein